MRFAADAMLGRLATWLRLLGYDTFYQADIDDRLLAQLAANEGRTILSRDVGLTQRRGVNSLLIGSDDVWSQLQQVVIHFGLRPDRRRLGGRCPRCNQSLELLPKAAAAGRVPAYVWSSQDEYRECHQCRRVFWSGSHVTEMESRLRALLEELDENRNRQ